MATDWDSLLTQGIRLFNKGEFFRCHEVLEEAWKVERGPLRVFLQALIHIAVGFYHYQRGNAVGAVRQLAKAVGKLEASLPRFAGVDTSSLNRDVCSAVLLIQAGTPLPSYPQIRSDSDGSSEDQATGP
ncbi:MAG: DUF309 domain-containing protein [Bryobacteraceae bacterium]